MFGTAPSAKRSRSQSLDLLGFESIAEFGAPRSSGRVEEGRGDEPNTWVQPESRYFEEFQTGYKKKRAAGDFSSRSEPNPEETSALQRTGQLETGRRTGEGVDRGEVAGPVVQGEGENQMVRAEEGGVVARGKEKGPVVRTEGGPVARGEGTGPVIWREGGGPVVPRPRSAFQVVPPPKAGGWSYCDYYGGFTQAGVYTLHLC